MRSSLLVDQVRSGPVVLILPLCRRWCWRLCGGKSTAEIGSPDLECSEWLSGTFRLVFIEVVLHDEQVLERGLDTIRGHFFITFNVIVLDWVDERLLTVSIQGRQATDDIIILVHAEVLLFRQIKRLQLQDLIRHTLLLLPFHRLLLLKLLLTSRWGLQILSMLVELTAL